MPAFRDSRGAHILGTEGTSSTAADMGSGEGKRLDLHVLTASEVASVLRVNIDAIIQAISIGELPGNRIGAQWRVSEEALIRWLQGT
jgi:excisionase family DNA binding protein